jgi:hypothetical protein
MCFNTYGNNISNNKEVQNQYQNKNQNQEKFFYNFNSLTQIFIFTQIKNLLKIFSNEENFAKEFNFETKEILRIKEIYNINNNNNITSFLVVLNSNLNIKENQQKIISNKNVNYNIIIVKILFKYYSMKKNKILSYFYFISFLYYSYFQYNIRLLMKKLK